MIWHILVPKKKWESRSDSHSANDDYLLIPTSPRPDTMPATSDTKMNKEQTYTSNLLQSSGNTDCEQAVAMSRFGEGQRVI